MAEGLNDGWRQYKQRKLKESLLTFETLGIIGFESAQANAGYLLYNEGKKKEKIEGEDSKLYFNRARKYYEMSAGLGNANSHLMIAKLYHKGIGIVKSLEMSRKAYKRASELRNAEAMFRLGRMYHTGEGDAKPDLHLAKRYYDMAAAANSDTTLVVYLSLITLYFASSMEMLKELWNDGQITSLFPSLGSAWISHLDRLSLDVVTPLGNLYFFLLMLKLC